MPADGEAIRTAVRELLEGTIGSVRAMTPGVLKAAQNADRAVVAQQLAARSVGARAAFLVDVQSAGDHPSSPPENGSLGLEVVTIEVMTWHKLSHHLERATTRDVSLGSVNTDASAIREAMCLPTNLLQTSASDATGIIPGSVQWLGSTKPRVYQPSTGPAAAVAEVTHRYSAWVQTDRSVGAFDDAFSEAFG